jgi:hypothetical protein
LVVAHYFKVVVAAAAEQTRVVQVVQASVVMAVLLLVMQRLQILQVAAAGLMATMLVAQAVAELFMSGLKFNYVSTILCTNRRK